MSYFGFDKELVVTIFHNHYIFRVLLFLLLLSLKVDALVRESIVLLGYIVSRNIVWLNQLIRLEENDPKAGLVCEARRGIP